MNIILVFPKKEINKKMSLILSRNGFHVTAVCLTGAQALYAAGQMGEGIILCGIRLTDMMYHELKDALPDSFEMVVLSASAQWEQYGENDVKNLTFPVKVYDLVETMTAVSDKLFDRLRRQRSKPRKRSPEEQNIINQAKKYLMDYEGYTEEGAHRFLQKYSMDSGLAMTETAGRILRKQIAIQE